MERVKQSTAVSRLEGGASNGNNGDGDLQNSRRGPVSFEAVAQAAEELEALGENVTVARVRMRIGGGNQTLAPWVRQWKETRRSRGRMGEHHKLLSTVALDALAREIDEHIARARAEAQEDLEDLQGANQELEEVHKSLQEAIITQEEQLEELREELRLMALKHASEQQAFEVARSKTEGQIETLTGQNKDQQSELSQLREAAVEARFKNAGQMSQIAALQKDVQRLQEACDARQSRIAEAQQKAAVAQQEAQGKDALLKVADERLREAQKRGHELSDQLELARSDAWAAKSAQQSTQRELDAVVREQKKAKSTSAVGFGQQQGAQTQPTSQEPGRHAPSPAPGSSPQQTRGSRASIPSPASASERPMNAAPEPSGMRMTPYERERQISSLTASSDTMRQLGKPATHEERERKKDLLVKAAGLRDIHLQRAGDMAPAESIARKQHEITHQAPSNEGCTNEVK